MDENTSKVYVLADDQGRITRCEGGYTTGNITDPDNWVQIDAVDVDEHCYSVYKHTSPSGKVYIGMTSMEPEKRWKAGYKDCKAFYRCIQKYGWENIKSEIIFSGLTWKEACELEIKMIALYDSTNPEYGYNILSGGNLSRQGIEVSEITREKLSQANKQKWADQFYKEQHSGENAYWYGKHHKPETIQKIKDNHADQSGENHPMFGKKHTAEAKQKMSEAKIGKYLGGNGVRAKCVLQMDSDFNVIQEYRCILDAEKATGAKAPNISKVLYGKRNFAGGYRWKLKEAN